MTGLVIFFAAIGLPSIVWLLLAIVWLLLLVVWLLLFRLWSKVARDRMDEHWPAGLDEEPTLNVQNGIGDSRPLR